MILKIYKDNEIDELKILRERSNDIPEVTDQIRQLAANMAETMYSAHGVGLAAPQVGQNISMFVYDVSPERNNWNALINPLIIEKSEEMCVGNEACLSVPDYEAEVIRHKKVIIEGINLDGQTVRIEAEDLPARVFQHETDHLVGQLYTDIAIPGTKKPAENFDV